MKFLCLSIAFVSAVSASLAQANCDQAYEDIVRVERRAIDWCGQISNNKGEMLSTTTLGASISICEKIHSAKLKSYQTVEDIIQEARIGAGPNLQKFSKKMAPYTKQEVIEVVLNLDQNEALCHSGALNEGEFTNFVRSTLDDK